MTTGTGQPDDLLLVEDTVGDLRLIKEAFSEAQLETTIHAVSTGEQALDFMYQRDEYATAPEPDVILLDWNLPTTDGGAVLSELKADFSQIPVVVMTGTRAKEATTGSNTAPADAYLTKPSDPNKYVEAIRSVYRSKQ